MSWTSAPQGLYLSFFILSGICHAETALTGAEFDFIALALTLASGYLVAVSFMDGFNEVELVEHEEAADSEERGG